MDQVKKGKTEELNLERDFLTRRSGLLLSAKAGKFWRNRNESANMRLVVYAMERIRLIRHCFIRGQIYKCYIEYERH